MKPRNENHVRLAQEKAAHDAGVASHRDFALADWANCIRLTADPAHDLGDSSTDSVFATKRQIRKRTRTRTRKRPEFGIWSRIRGGAGGEVESRKPSVVEEEALAQEGLAEKTIDHHYIHALPWQWACLTPLL